MAITIRNVWQSGTASAAASCSTIFTNAPVSGDLIVCCATVDSTSITLTPSDNTADGVAWSTAKGPDTLAGLAQSSYIFYKQAGTGTGGKTITVTPNTGNHGYTMYIATYNPGVASTWAIDGTAVAITGTAVTNPAPGAITILTGSLAIGFCSVGATLPTAGSGFTRQITATAFNVDAVEDQVVAGTTVNCNWTHGSDFTIAQGAAFKATASGGSTRPVKMAGEWGGYAGVGGGFAG
jgi:hypothetical protein